MEYSKVPGDWKKAIPLKYQNIEQMSTQLNKGFRKQWNSSENLPTVELTAEKVSINMDLRKIFNLTVMKLKSLISNNRFNTIFSDKCTTSGLVPRILTRTSQKK